MSAGYRGSLHRGNSRGDVSKITFASVNHRRALVFDCGTGSTRAIFFEALGVAQDGLVVFSATQLAHVKPLAECLAANAEGSGEEFAEAVRRIVKEQCEKQQGERAPDVVLFGMTAWARAKELPVRGALDALAERLPGIVRAGAADAADTIRAAASSTAPQSPAPIEGGIEVLLLDNAQEALLECSAVKYAAQRSGTAVPSCVLGSGGGSVQFTLHGVPPQDSGEGGGNSGAADEDEAHYLPLGFREGKALVLTQGVEGLRSWEARVRAELGAHATRHGLRQQPGDAIGISACYYGAKDVGLPLDGGPGKAKAVTPGAKTEAQRQGGAGVAASEVISAYDAFLARQWSVLRRDVAKTNRWATEAKALANIVLQRELIRVVLRPGARLHFRRTWQLPSTGAVDAFGTPVHIPGVVTAAGGGGDSSIPFLSTWSSGWFLQHVQRQANRTPAAAPTAAQESIVTESSSSARLGAGAGAGAIAGVGAGAADQVVDTETHAASSKRASDRPAPATRSARGRLKTVLGVVGVAAITAHVYKHKDSSNWGLNAGAMRESLDSMKSLWDECVQTYFSSSDGDKSTVNTTV